MSPATLVIRFSSLGDVVLTGAVTGQLAPVALLTRAAWAPVAACLPGVSQVYTWEDVKGGRQTLARRWARIVDLHASPRSRRLCAGLQGPVSRVDRWDLRRRTRVWFKAGAPPPLVIERYAAAAGVRPAQRPWLPGWQPTDTLALCPGAAHSTKRWPAERFAELGRRWQGPVAVLGGPGDSDLVAEIAAAIGPRARPIAERGFDQTLAALREAAAAVAGDTGLLHLATALGVPVVGLFGPTTSSDGFWDATTGTVVEEALPCRPCSLHGGPACPIGDHLCMERLDVDRVESALRVLLTPDAGRQP